MMTSAAQHGGDPHSSGWFLLVWALFALPGGVALASRGGSAWFHRFLVGLFRSGRFPRTVPTPVWGIRAGGVVFALAGLVGIPVGIWLVVR